MQVFMVIEVSGKRSDVTAFSSLAAAMERAAARHENKIACAIVERAMDRPEEPPVHHPSRDYIPPKGAAVA